MQFHGFDSHSKNSPNTSNMGKSLWFKIRGKEGNFFRCAVCKCENRYDDVVGCYIIVANETVAIVCGGDCVKRAGELIIAALPAGKLATCDAEGYEIKD